MKKRALVVAIASALSASPDVEAVYLDPHGFGQALIYPYYTVQSVDGNPFNTYVSVLNSTPRAKVVRVRFREGKRGAEVGNFNLYLSPNDMWTGAVVPQGSGAKLVSADVSCTNPPLTTNGAFAELLFSNGNYTLPDDTMGTGLDRTREGYVEMIEMGTLTGTAAANVVHRASGLPGNCGAVQGVGVAVTSVEAPAGGLAGTATLINVALGLEFSVNAVALADLTTQSFYRNFNDPYPDFDSAEVTPLSHINANGKQYRLQWARGVDAVSAVLMRGPLANEYVLDAGTRSSTDWVMTFPTKRFYVDGATATAPFSNVFAASGACESVSFAFYGRETEAPQCPFSPGPPCGVPLSVCWTSTVASIRTAGAANPLSVLGSSNATTFTPATQETAFTSQNGWALESFTGANASFAVGLRSLPSSTVRDLATDQVATGAQRLLGLPVLGLMVRTFQNGTLSCSGTACQGNYGGAFPHKAGRNILP